METYIHAAYTHLIDLLIDNLCMYVSDMGQAFIKVLEAPIEALLNVLKYKHKHFQFIEKCLSTYSSTFKMLQTQR